MAKIDVSLDGKKFGRWTVLEYVGNKNKTPYYKCKCECGTIKEVSREYLMNGISKSCGCLHKEIASQSNFIDLTGQNFGKLKVIELDIERSTNKKYNIWKCLCECQTICYVSSTNLFTGRIYSCGCVRSRGEEKITKILNEKNISFQKEYSFENLINPKTGCKLRFDFALFNNQNKLICLIEFDGYQHFLTDSNGYYTKEKILDLKYRDNLKNDYCKNNKIKLIRISYKDYNKLDWNFLEEKINERF